MIEIKAEDESGTFRTIYATKLGKRLYVLHAFQKKSTHGITTPKAHLTVIHQRLKEARLLAKEEEP